MTVKTAEADAPAVLAGARALEERIDVKRWALWVSLLAGVAFLGWMAWRLSRQMSERAKPSSTTPETTSPRREA